MSEIETSRLQRQLRATTAVNRQLHAQLDAAPGGRGSGGSTTRRGPSGVRRASVGSAWLQQLAAASRGGARPVLAAVAKRGTWLIEGTQRRRIRSGLLATALEQRLGRPRLMESDELDRHGEGVPVEVFEGPTGPPFVVIGGERLPIKGLPVPYPVGEGEGEDLPEGPTLDVSPRAIVRSYLRRMADLRTQQERVARAVERHGGVGPAAKAFADKLARKVGRRG